MRIQASSDDTGSFGFPWSSVVALAVVAFFAGAASAWAFLQDGARIPIGLSSLALLGITGWTVRTQISTWQSQFGRTAEHFGRQLAEQEQAQRTSASRPAV